MLKMTPISDPVRTIGKKNTPIPLKKKTVVDENKKTTTKKTTKIIPSKTKKTTTTKKETNIDHFGRWQFHP